MNFKKLGIEDGLSQSTILSVYKDRDGFIWFGGTGSLDRYDGSVIRSYQNFILSSLNLNTLMITCIAEEKDGILWLGTTGNGILLLNKKNESLTLLTHHNDDSHSLRSNTVFDIFRDSNHNIWVATSEGLSVYKDEQQGFIHFANAELEEKNLGGKQIGSLAEDSKGNIWTCSKEGVLIKFDVKDSVFVNTQLAFKGDNQLSLFNFPQTYVDSKDNVMVGTSNGLFILRNSDNEIQYIKHFNKGADQYMNVTSIYEMDENMYLVATFYDGLFLYNSLTGNYVNYSSHPDADYQTSTYNYSVIMDSDDGIIWTGTYNDGVHWFNKNANHLNVLQDIVKKADKDLWSYPAKTFCIAPDKNIWVGTEGNGINVFDPRQLTTTNLHSTIPAAIITCIFRRSESNNIFIGTYYQGIYIYDWKNHKAIQYSTNSGTSVNLVSNSVVSVIEDNEHNIWMGYSDQGVEVLNPQTGIKRHFKHVPGNATSLSDNNVAKIFEDHTGKIWIGTSNGLNVFNDSLNNFQRFEPFGKEGFFGVSIMDIFEDSFGNLWIGTDQGLNLYNRMINTFSHYNVNSQSALNLVMRIQEDADHYLWLTTHNRIHKFNPVSRELLSFEAAKDGKAPGFIAGSGIALYDDVYFGSSRGVYLFKPEQITENTHIPPVYITSLSINYQTVNLHTPGSVLHQNISYTDEIKLNYKQSTFSLIFNALEYVNPDKIQYAYMLEGFDDEWIYTNNLRRAVYTKINPGTYTFRVISSDNNGKWTNSGGTQLKIIITAPFWATWWFRIMAGLITVLIIVAVFYNRSRQQIRKQKILKELIAKRTEELYEANIILTDHHEELIQKNEEITLQNEKLSQMSEEIIKQNTELEQHRLHLEQLVAERTSELEIAKIKAEESDKLKSAFLANMSHEIRTPMNAIVGFANLLKDRNYSFEEKHDFIEIITANSEVLLVLIQDILDLSLIEADQIKIKKETFNLNDLVESIHSSTLMMNKKEKLEIRLNNELENKKLKLKTDKVRLKQIISNLLNNAYKFTENGFVELGCRTEGGSIIIYIRDTGIGISEDELPRIFDRFRKSEAKKNTFYRGAGLGLAISKALAKLLNCVLKVESKPGKGSVFSLVIPENIVTNYDGKEVDEITHNIKAQKWADKNILIVEDEKANFAYLRKILDQTAVKIHWAQNGLEAIEILATGIHFNLVIMDIKMPGMDGFEATKIIKENNTKQPVVALTAYARPEDRLSFSEAGFDDYLTKPIKPHDFISVVGRFF